MTTRFKQFVAILIGGWGIAATPSSGAVVTITDCTNDTHITTTSSATRIEIGGDDLVLRCALTPLPGTDAVRIAAHDVTIDGPDGSIRADGTGGAINIQASGMFSANDTELVASNNNGNLDIEAVGDMSFDAASLTVGLPGDGDRLRVECTGEVPKCRIQASDATWKARKMFVTGVGDIELSSMALVTNSPIDKITITSTMGNVDLAGTGCESSPVCGNQCDPGGGGGSCGVNISMGVEGDLEISAFGFVDLKFATVLVAQNIHITSGVGAGPASVPAQIETNSATLRNDFGKKGEIVLLADETLETIDISNAILVDDDPSPSTPDVAELNGCEVTPRTPCPNVVGTPALDG